MSNKQLIRSTNDRMVAGVAGGIANYFNIDTTLVRLLFVIFTLAGGPGLLVYIVMWLVMPEQNGAAQSTQDDDLDEEIIIEKSA